MRSHTLVCDLLLPKTLEETFAVFEDPYNLAAITPPWLHFRILTADLRMKHGAEIDYRFTWVGIPLLWKTLITEYNPPHSFTDEALQSPYVFWRHHHTFTSRSDGTLVKDRVDYKLPFGPVGALVHALAISSQLQRIFAYRQQAVGRLLNVDAIRQQPPRIIPSPRTKPSSLSVQS